MTKTEAESTFLPLRRKSWPGSGWITSTYNLTFTTVDNNADDWEVRLPNGRIVTDFKNPDLPHNGTIILNAPIQVFHQIPEKIVVTFDKMPPFEDKNGNALVLVAENDYSLMLNYIARDLDVLPGEVMSILREANNVRKEREDE